MKDESLQEFMKHVSIKNKNVAIYENKEKGLCYPLSLTHLLCRVDYLELTKEELTKAKFEQKVDDKDYQMYDCERIVPKYEITKIEADKYTLTTKKVKATHIWNVTNQVGIHTTFDNVDEAFEYCESVNNETINYMHD